MMYKMFFFLNKKNVLVEKNLLNQSNLIKDCSSLRIISFRIIFLLGQKLFLFFIKFIPLNRFEINFFNLFYERIINFYLIETKVSSSSFLSL